MKTDELTVIQAMIILNLKKIVIQSLMQMKILQTHRQVRAELKINVKELMNIRDSN